MKPVSVLAILVANGVVPLTVTMMLLNTVGQTAAPLKESAQSLAESIDAQLKVATALKEAQEALERIQQKRLDLKVITAPQGVRMSEFGPQQGVENFTFDQTTAETAAITAADNARTCEQKGRLAKTKADEAKRMIDLVQKIYEPTVKLDDMEGADVRLNLEYAYMCNKLSNACAKIILLSQSLENKVVEANAMAAKAELIARQAAQGTAKRIDDIIALTSSGN